MDEKWGRARHQTGTAAEHYAASWFLDCGYSVWWPANQHTGTDFLATTKRKHLRIQVKKASWSKRLTTSKSKRQFLSVHTYGKASKRREYDVLIAVDFPRLWWIPKRAIRTKNLILDARGSYAIKPGSGLAHPKRYNPDKWRVR